MTYKLGQVFGNIKPPLSHKEDPRLVMPRTDLGLEFEFEGVKNKQKELDAEFGLLWEEHKEPSLHDAGREFAFRAPMFGEDVLTAVEHLLKFAKTNDWRASMRAGIHVHQDVRNMTYHQLVGELVHYAITEPAIYAWVGDGREANNFCAPWYKCEGSVYDAAKLVSMIPTGENTPEKRETLKSVAENFHKYAGLNLRSLHNYCTIEFRHLQTTLDYDRVVKWLNIVLNLQRAAMSAPESSMAIIGEASKNIDRFLIHVFGEQIVGEMQERSKTLRHDIETIGIPNALEFLAGLNVNDAFVNAAEKEFDISKRFKGVDRWIQSTKKEEPSEKENLKASKKAENSVTPLVSMTFGTLSDGLHPPQWPNSQEFYVFDDES